MSQTLAIIPAKRHSVGAPDKNWKPIIGTKSCLELAGRIGRDVCNRVFVTSDVSTYEPVNYWVTGWIQRPPDMPDTMLAVVQHALEAVPGPDDEIIVLLQPSSPLRTAETVRKAIQMLEDDQSADSVVSVSPGYPREWLLEVIGDHLEVPSLIPTRRQDCWPVYRRDGVVYTFRRKTIQVHGNIYGRLVLPLHTPPAEALSIDTQADWDEAVRRLSSSSDSQAGDTSSPA